MAFLPNLPDMYARMFGRGSNSTPAMLPKLASGQGIDFAAKAIELQRLLDDARLMKAKGMAGGPAGEMVSGHYVPNYGGMVSNFANSMMGGMQEREAAEQMAQLSQAQQEEQSKLWGEMPMGTEATPPQAPMLPMPLGGPGPVEVESERPMIPGSPATAASPRALLEWTTRLQKVNPKLAESVMGKVLEHQLDAALPRRGAADKPSLTHVDREVAGRKLRFFGTQTPQGFMPTGEPVDLGAVEDKGDKGGKGAWQQRYDFIRTRLKSSNPDMDETEADRIATETATTDVTLAGAVNPFLAAKGEPKEARGGATATTAAPAKAPSVLNPFDPSYKEWDDPRNEAYAPQRPVPGQIGPRDSGKQHELRAKHMQEFGEKISPKATLDILRPIEDIKKRVASLDAQGLVQRDPETGRITKLPGVGYWRNTKLGDIVNLIGSGADEQAIRDRIKQVLSFTVLERAGLAQSVQEAERIYDALGLGAFQGPESFLRALDELHEEAQGKLRGRMASFSPVIVRDFVRNLGDSPEARLLRDVYGSPATSAPNTTSKTRKLNLPPGTFEE